MVRSVVTSVMGLVSGAALAALAAAPAWADCTCRAQGRDFGLGRTICLSTPAGSRLATCDMVLNNTSWKISANPCTEVSARRGRRNGDTPPPIAITGHIADRRP